MKMLKYIGLSALGLMLPTVQAFAQTPVVKIAQGELSGALTEGVVSFLGIPFAAPPVGNLRWQPPAPPPNWTNARQASAFGPACPQPERSEVQNARQVASQSEDCLTLNVWSATTVGKAPVMVWLHGGGHRVGSGSAAFYNGTGLARQGVVAVTVNYRLGLLGYFAHPALTEAADANAPLGNYGLMDQIAALRWVRDNIHAFGGDPDNITVFGESAGGASVLYLLATPSAKGLFAKAIVQSGGGLQIPKPMNQAAEDGRAVMQSLGLSSQPTLEQMRALPASKLVDAIPLEGLGFGPFVDGRLVIETPAQAFAAGRAHDVPLLIGANSNEASVATTLNVGAQAILSFLGNRLDSVRAAYGGASITEQEFTRQVFGDALFVGPARWVAQQASAGAPAYLYHFDYVLDRRRAEQPGAGHGTEIPHIFRSWDQFAIADRLLSDSDRRFSVMISQCWVMFAKAGKPHCEGLRDWPAYSKDADTLMELSSSSGLRANFRKPKLDAVLLRSDAASSMVKKPN